MEIRVARDGDTPGIAAAHVLSWQGGYQGLLPQDFLERLDPAQRLPAWERILAETDLPRRGTLVAGDGDTVAGFVSFGPSRDADTDPERTGEVFSIYLRPQDWRRGLGRSLMNAAVSYLAEAGYGEVVLWVLDANSRARGFYEACGWAADGSAKREDMPGFTVTEVRYRRSLP